MNRRAYLGIVGTAILSGGCVEKVKDTVSTSGRYEDGVWTLERHGFEKMFWNSDGLLTISWTNSHDMDGWGVRYHSKSEPDDDIIGGVAPEYGSEETHDILNAIKIDNAPTGKYDLFAYEGQDMGIAFNVTEVIGGISFTISPELSCVSSEITDDGEISLEVVAEGNAPDQILSVSAEDKKVNVGKRVSMDTPTKVLVNNNLFKLEDSTQGDCIEIPPEAEVVIDSLSGNIQKDIKSGYNEGRRKCTISF